MLLSLSHSNYPLTRATARSITKMRENCLQDFEKHWKCLDWNNQVRTAVLC